MISKGRAYHLFTGRNTQHSIFIPTLVIIITHFGCGTILLIERIQVKSLTFINNIYLLYSLFEYILFYTDIFWVLETRIDSDQARSCNQARDYFETKGPV